MKILNNDYLSINNKLQFINKFKNINFKNYNIFEKEYIMNETEYHTILNFQNKLINNEKIINLTNNKSYYKNSNKSFNNNIYLYTNKKFKISLIIVCDELKFLEITIKSIINQINYNYEIIIIYDNNYKYDLNLIKKYIEKYKNIKIINNNSHKGLLYSYSIGILNSKGEYILILQSGYTLSKKNILDELYNIANNNNIDALEFNLLINKNDNNNKISLSIYKCQHFKSKIDLNLLKYNKNYIEIDQNKELLFNKLIKSNIYKDIIYKYRLDKYEFPIYNYYEEIILFLLNKNYIIFKHINIYGLIQNTNNINNLKLKNIINDKKQKINDSIFYINFLFENSQNSFNEKKYVLYEFINLLSVIYNKYIPNSYNSNKLLKKFIDCDYLNKENKDELFFFYNSLIN